MSSVLFQSFPSSRGSTSDNTAAKCGFVPQIVETHGKLVVEAPQIS